MINPESIEKAIAAQDTRALLSLKSRVNVAEFKEWISLVPHRLSIDYNSRSLNKCRSGLVQCSPPIEYPSDWPKIHLAYIGKGLSDHLGVLSIALSCPHCFTGLNESISANAVHAWAIYDLHAWDCTRNILTLSKCERCNHYALVSCYDWDSDPDYVFTYRGHLWLDKQDPIFDAIERIHTRVSITGGSN